MPTAAEDLREYLEGLQDEKFLDFCDSIGFERIVPESAIQARYSRHNEGLISLRRYINRFKKTVSDVRPEATTDICMSAYSYPELFARACDKAGIQTDDARALDLQRISANATADASQSARISASAATASEKHAETANRIAEKSNRLSLVSLIVAVVAVLFAGGSLAVAILALSK